MVRARHEIEHLLNKDGQQVNHLWNVDVDLDPEDRICPKRNARQPRSIAILCRSGRFGFLYDPQIPIMAERDTLGLARRLQRHPGIVVGQLQFRMAVQYKVNKYNWLAKHKVKIRQFLKGAATMDGWADPVSMSL